MANDNSLDRLAADIESAAFQNGVDQKLWELIARAGTALDVRIAASDSAWYLIRLDCTDYWDQAISGQFIDRQTKQSVPSAWPQGHLNTYTTIYGGRNDIKFRINLPSNDNNIMPPSGPLSAADLTKINNWIDSGAAGCD